MSTAPRPTATDVEVSRQRDLVALLVAVAIAIIVKRFVTAAVRDGHVPSPVLQVVTADLAVWVPLAAGCLWVLRRASWRSAVTRLGFGWGDVIVAVGIVVVCRGLDASLSIAFTGSSGLTPAPVLGPPDVGLLVVSALGVVLVSPFLEEVFFRGVFQRRLANSLKPCSRFLPVLLTAVLFAIVHLLITSPANSLIGFEVLGTTFVLGALIGTLVAMTGRLGGAILAHVLFNVVAVAATWPR